MEREEEWTKEKNSEERVYKRSEERGILEEEEVQKEKKKEGESRACAWFSQAQHQHPDELSYEIH